MKKYWIVFFVVWSMLGSSVHADTRYEFTGDNFEFAQGRYTTAMRVEATITTSVPIPANVSRYDITPIVTSFSVSDGVQTITSASGAVFDPRQGTSFTTFADGRIRAWYFSATKPVAVNVGDEVNLIQASSSFGDLAGIGMRCSAIDADGCINFSGYIPPDYGQTSNFVTGNWEIVDVPSEPESIASVRAIEVNQAVQDWENSIHFFPGKDTMIRVFLEDTGSANTVPNLGGKLHIYTSSGIPGTPITELPGSPIDYVGVPPALLTNDDGNTSSPPYSAIRRFPDSSLNFFLPAEFVDEADVIQDVVFSFVPDSPGELECGGVTEKSLSAEACSVSVYAVANDAVANRSTNIGLLAISYPDTNDPSGQARVTPTGEDLVEQILRLRTTMPTNELGINLIGTIEYDSALGTGTSNKRLLEYRETLRASCPECYPNDFAIFGFALGFSSCSKPCGTGRADKKVQTTYSGGTERENSKGYARNRGSHEMGHIYGKAHAGDPEIARVFNEEYEAYVFTGCKSGEIIPLGQPLHPYWGDFSGIRAAALGPTDSGPDAEIWGFDTRLYFAGLSGFDNNLIVVNPYSTNELMGYCGSGGQARWPSKFTYERLRFGISDAITSDGSTSAVAFDGAVAVTGSVDLETGVVEISPAVYIGSALNLQAPGDIAFSLRDVAGNEFDTFTVAASLEQGDLEEGEGAQAARLFIGTFALPDQPLGSLEISDTSGVLATVYGSPNSPAMTLLSPLPEDVIDAESVTIDWEVSDADGDDVFTSVFYSHDGVMWKPLALNTSSNSLEVSRFELMGSDEAYLRFSVSDGLNLTVDDYGPYQVAASAAKIVIANPTDEEIIDGGTQVIFEAFAYSQDGSLLENEDLSWESDVDGYLGDGGRVMVAAGRLMAGCHKLTATRPSADGSVTSIKDVYFGVDTSLPCARPTPNSLPEAVIEITSTQPVIVGEEVLLDGSQSSDSDGDLLAFSWNISAAPTGSTASIPATNTQQASFVPDVAGTFEITLVVDDMLSGTDSTVIELNVIKLDASLDDLLVEVDNLLAVIRDDDQEKGPRVKALTNKFSAVKKMIEKGQFVEARTKLVDDIKERISGCADDSVADKNDFVESCSYQAELNQIVDEIVLALWSHSQLSG